MNAQQRRALIAQKSPIQAAIDVRPRCEDCGNVLVRSDYLSYWDGQDPYVDGCLAPGDDPTPRCCEECADKP